MQHERNEDSTDGQTGIRHGHVIRMSRLSMIRMACTWEKCFSTPLIVSVASLRSRPCSNHMLTPSHRTRAPEASSTQRRPGCPTPASRSPSSRASCGRAYPSPCTAQAPPRRTCAPGSLYVRMSQSVGRGVWVYILRCK